MFATLTGGRRNTAMKTRIIQTRFWDDDTVQSVSSDARLLWIFLLTNKELGMTNYVRIPDRFIEHYLSFTTQQLTKAKKELEGTGKILFIEPWIYIRNLEKENKYKDSPKLEQPYKKELACVPEKIVRSFNAIIKRKYSAMDTTINSTMDSSHKQKTKNNKPKRGECEGGDKKPKKNYEGEFEKFWDTYPKKVGKKKAKEVYTRLVEKDPSLSELVLSGLRRQLPLFNRTEARFIPHPTTWLNQGRWEDEPEKKIVREPRTEPSELKKFNVEDYKKHFEKLGLDVDV